MTSRAEMKRVAQDMIMSNVGNALGYWTESPECRREWLDPDSEEAQQFRAELKRQADRIARMFGFDEAWSN